MTQWAYAASATPASIGRRSDGRIKAIRKWHLGGIKGARPEDVGFDESLGFIAGASMYLPENDPDVVNVKQEWDPIDLFHWYGTVGSRCGQRGLDEVDD